MSNRAQRPLRVIVAGLAVLLLVVAGTVAIGQINGRESLVAAAPAVVYPAALADLPLGVTRFVIQPGTGHLWFPSITPDGSNRLFRHDPAAGVTSSWRLPADPGGGWFAGLSFASRDQLWIAWDQTLVKFNASAATATRYVVPPASRFQVTDGKARWVRAVAAGADGGVWLSRDHAASLLRFDPVRESFEEFGLPTFGVPRQILEGPDGLLWLTVARDSTTGKEHTRTARFDTVTKRTELLQLPLFHMSFDDDGSPVGLGLSGLTRFSAGSNDLAADVPVQRVSSGDLIATWKGRSLVTTRSSSVLALDWRTRSWTTQKLEASRGRISGPKGYEGPRELEVLAEVTDIRVDRASGRVWLLVASQKRFAYIDTP